MQKKSKRVKWATKYKKVLVLITVSNLPFFLPISSNNFQPQTNKII